MILDGPFSIQIAIVKLAICYKAVIAGYCFDILRNKSASTDKLRKHQGPWSAPHLVRVYLDSTFEFEFEFCTFRASTGPVLVQMLKKTESRMPPHVLGITFQKKSTS